MQLRSLRRGDGERMRHIARRSMESGYDAIIPAEAIDEAVEEWYDSEAIAGYLAEDDMAFVVGAIDDAVVGFAQSHVVEEFGKGRVLWVHVDPDYRGMGIGTDLLNEMVDRLHERGIESVTAVVLADYDEGIAFYEATGFQKLADRTITIGGEEFRELIMREERSPDQPLELQVDGAGNEYYVDLAETDRGSRGPFCPVYRDPHRTHRYGWFCTACESLETAMDSMGRISCSNCDNTRRPTRWDAAYL